MKPLYKILTAILLIFSLMLSFISCDLLNGNSEDSDESGANEEEENGDTVMTPDDESKDENDKNPDNTENGDDTDKDNNTGDDGDKENENGTDGNDKENGGDNNTDTEGGDESDDEENKDPVFVPDMTKKNEIADASLPHLDYYSLKQDSYNSELFYKNSYEIPLGDPTVLVNEENGVKWFYVTGTTTSTGFEMWKTKDFTEWEKLGTVYNPSDSFFGKSSFWAPQLIYDADADWSYYLGKDGGSGKGLYILFFSARKSNNVCALSVAFSKNIEGPYKNFVGVNANGDYIDESNTLFDIEKLKGLKLYSDHTYGDLYKAKRSFIDASPFVDPETGDKYLYMVRSRNVDVSNDVWGVKMKDWVTPDYPTTTPLSSYGYTDIEKSEEYGYLAAIGNKIDEGPFLYYKDYTDDGVKNGKYYLTLSIGGTSDKIYPVCQAIGDSPLGPFTKIQPEKGGLLNHPELHWDIHGSGHHAFFEVDGELYVAYHTYALKSDNTIARRYFAFDKVEWVYNADGQYIMRSNGPSKSVNPLPSAASGYTNVAKDSAVTVSGTNAAGSVLTDGIVAIREGDENLLFSFADNVEITLDFKEYVNARAIIFYNSYDFATAFSKIDKIELSYRKEIDGRLYYGVATIDSLIFNFNSNLIPKSYLEAAGETNTYQLRPSSTAIAEFDEIEINSVKIYISNSNADAVTALSEIIILGKECDRIVADELGLGGYTAEPSFEPYTAFTGEMPKEEPLPEDLVKIDGYLDESLWTDLASVTVIAGATIDNETKAPVDLELYGERSAKVYTYIGKRNLYFAFEVTDKNLFFNSSQPQGRSTCVEIYFTTADNNILTDGCYSIRINPTGQSGAASCNIGIYVPNDAGNEWKFISLNNVVTAVSTVTGYVETSENDTDYDKEQNVGYTVEIAIDKILIGLLSDSLRFTAAFVQDRGYNEPRIGNTFIPGTHYVKPATWIVFKNKDTDTEA